MIALTALKHLFGPRHVAFYSGRYINTHIDQVLQRIIRYGIFALGFLRISPVTSPVAALATTAAS
jgi:hypothetical protein